MYTKRRLSLLENKTESGTDSAMVCGTGSRTCTAGFSLLETLLYLGIFAIIGGSLFGILTNVVRVSTREITSDEVASQLQFAMETVSRLVRESSAIETDATATSTLKLRMQDPALDPTCVFVQNGVLKMSSGPDAFQSQNCTSIATDITTDKVIVDTAFFKRVEFPGGHDQVAVDLQFSNTATGPNKISRALRSGIARVSAATFDSDLLPNADDSYEVGFSGTKRWKNISISNVLNLGVIASDPGGIDGSIYYNSTSKSFRGKANGAWGDIGSSLWTATSTHMYSNVSGNVGIGTAAPGAPLHVSSTGAELLRIERTGSNQNVVFSAVNTAGTTYFGRPTTNFFSIGPNLNLATSPYFSINTSGNIGIGTASVSSGLKLDVEGKIGATEYCDAAGGNCKAITAMGVPTGLNGVFAPHRGDDISIGTSIPNPCGSGTASVFAQARVPNGIVQCGYDSGGSIGPDTFVDGVECDTRVIECPGEYAHVIITPLGIEIEGELKLTWGLD